MESSLRILMSARAVVAIGQPFAPRGEAMSDVDVARDEISWLRADAEPLVLRVTVMGGAEAERARVRGDWLCDSGGAEPVAVPAPAWFAESVPAWVRRRTWLSAWEDCENPMWLVRAAADAGVDRRLVVLAACACARSVLHLVATGGADRAKRAVEVAGAWARGEATYRLVHEMCREFLTIFDVERAPFAAQMALYTARDAAGESGLAPREFIVSAVASVSAALEAVGDDPTSLRELVVAVHRAIPTIAVLRAAVGK